MPSSLRRKAISGMITGLIQYISLMLMQILITPMIIKIAGQEALGSYAVLMQIISWAVISDFGISVAANRAIGQRIGGDHLVGEMTDIFTTARTFLVCTSILFSLVLVVLDINAGSIIKGSVQLLSSVRIAFGYLIIWTILRVPLLLFGEVLNARSHLATVNMIGLLSSSMRLLLSFFFLKLGLGLVGLVVAYITAEAIQLISQRILCKIQIKGLQFRWGFPDRALLRKLLIFGISVTVSMVASKIVYSTDNVLLSAIMNTAIVTVFYTSSMPTSILVQFVWKISDSFMPGINILKGSNRILEIKKIYGKLLKLNYFVSLLLMIGLIKYSEPVITIWVGKDQFAGSLFVIILSITSVLQVVNHLNSGLLIAYGSVKVLSIISIISGVVKIAINIILLPKLGLPGMALAGIFAESFLFFFIQIKLLQIFEFARKEIIATIARNALISAAFLLTILFPFFRISHQLVINVALNIITFVLVYFVLCYFFVLTKEEKQRVVKVLRKERIA